MQIRLFFFGGGGGAGPGLVNKTTFDFDDDMIFVGLTSRENGEFKLHTVKELKPKLSWNQLLWALLLFV